MISWIFSLFQSAVAEVIFVSIAIAGTIFSLASLVFGADHDGDIDHDGDGGSDSHEGPGFLSVRGISLFAGGFGATGFLVQYFTHKTLVASVAGVGVGCLMAILGMGFIRLFFQQQASSTIGPGQITGSTGVVTTSVPPKGQGYGEVALVVAGVQLSKPAMTDGDAALPRGVPVRVVKSFGGQVVVEKV